MIPNPPIWTARGRAGEHEGYEENRRGGRHRLPNDLVRAREPRGWS